MNPRPALSASLALLALAVPLAAHAQRGQPRFSDTTSTVLVEVPVQVLRDGQPVRGLTAADFEVYDGRKKQTIVGFDVHDLTTTAAATGAQRPVAITPAARRHFLILFDLAFSNTDSLLAARKAAADMVASLHPTDLVAVATYSALRGPELALGFTSDRGQIAAAVESLGLSFRQDRRADPLRLLVADQQKAAEAASRMADSRGGDGRAEIEAAALEELRTLTAAGAAADRAQSAAQVTRLTRGLSELARLMSAVSGRKYVVFMSEGFDSSIVQGTTDAQRRSEVSASSISGEIWMVDSDELYGDTGTLNDVEKMLNELRRADCVIQAVDIAGLRPAGDLSSSSAGGNDSLLNFAKSTGGELFENFNDLSDAMNTMLERTSVTYVLAFQPASLDWDGSFHRLRVELKGPNARGARLVHRPGYYAPQPYDARAGMERVVDAASQVVAGRDGGAMDLAVLAVPFAMPKENAYVPVLVEIAGDGLLAGASSQPVPAELYVYAFDSQGSVADFLTQTMGVDVAKVRPTLEQTGLKFFGHLELPPGDYSLRVLVRNGTTGASGLRNVPLRVPAFTAAEAALLPPLFPEPPNRWIMIREQPRGDYQQAPYPFMQGQQPYIPASRPVLKAGEKVTLSLVGYNLPTGDLRLEGRILGADGDPVATVPVKVTAQEAGSPLRVAASFEPPRLPAGEYRLEVRVPDGQGGHHTAATPFVVD